LGKLNYNGPLLILQKFAVQFLDHYIESYFGIFADFLLLGWVGQEIVETPFIEIGQIGTVFYFAYFLGIIPALGILENRLIRTII